MFRLESEDKWRSLVYVIARCTASIQTINRAVQLYENQSIDLKNKDEDGMNKKNSRGDKYRIIGLQCARKNDDLLHNIRYKMIRK